ncbi:MAG TPA: tetratricopeptide repeat protein [Thermoanaerobaculia bacterium]|jgi:Tfp pilus assembly protein PilF
MLPRSAKPVVFLMFLLVAAGVPVRGQSWAGKGRLQGSVKDESGKPVEGATITLRPGTGQVDPKAEGPKPVMTDRNGKWSILGLTGGAWGVLIQKPGFMDSEGQIKVNEYAIAQPFSVTLKVPPKEVAQQASQQVQKQNTQAAEAKAALERGNTLLQSGQYAQARAAYEEGMSKLEEKDRVALEPAIYLAIADSYGKEGKTNDAINALKKSLEVDPNNVDTLKLLVSLLVSANREAEAKPYMAKLPQGTTMDPAIRLNLGIKAYNEKKTDEALTQFNQVIAENPNLADVYYYRAMVYISQNKNAQAKADLQKLLQLEPNNKFAGDAKEFLKELK